MCRKAGGKRTIERGLRPRDGLHYGTSEGMKVQSNMQLGVTARSSNRATRVAICRRQPYHPSSLQLSSPSKSVFPSGPLWWANHWCQMPILPLFAFRIVSSTFAVPCDRQNTPFARRAHISSRHPTANRISRMAEPEYPSACLSKCPGLLPCPTFKRA